MSGLGIAARLKPIGTLGNGRQKASKAKESDSLDVGPARYVFRVSFFDPLMQSLLYNTSFAGESLKLSVRPFLLDWPKFSSDFSIVLFNILRAVIALFYCVVTVEKNLHCVIRNSVHCCHCTDHVKRLIVHLGSATMWGLLHNTALKLGCTCCWTV